MYIWRQELLEKNIGIVVLPNVYKYGLLIILHVGEKWVPDENDSVVNWNEKRRK